MERVKVKRHARKLGRGWRGDSYEHHLASKGEKVKGRNIHGSLGEIITFDLKKAQRRLTAVQISKRTGLSWQATVRHLEILHKEGKVKKIKVRSRTYWKYE